MARIQLSPSEILSHFKPCDPPPFFENFGPVKSPAQNVPISLDKKAKIQEQKPTKDIEIGIKSLPTPNSVLKEITFGTAKTGVLKQPLPNGVLSAAENGPKQAEAANTEIPAFAPKKSQPTFVPDFSEPARTESFESVINSNPSLPPGFNAVQIAETQQKQEANILITFDKIFEKEMIDRPDQAGHYIQRSSSPVTIPEQQQQQPQIVETKQNEQKINIPTFAPEKAKQAFVAPSISAGIQAKDFEEKKYHKPSFEDLEQEEDHERNGFQNIQQFEEEPPEFQPQFRPKVGASAITATLDEMERQKKQETKNKKPNYDPNENPKKKNKFAPYEPPQVEQAIKKKQTIEISPIPGVPQFNDIQKYVETTEGFAPKPSSYIDDDKPPVEIPGFQPKTANPIKFAPTLDEVEEMRKKEAAAKKAQNANVYSAVVDQTQKAKETKEQKTKKAPTLEFDRLFNEAENSQAKPEKKKANYTPYEEDSKQAPSLSFKPKQTNKGYYGTSIEEDANDESKRTTKKSGKAKKFVPFVMEEEIIATPVQQPKPVKKSEFDLLLEEEAKVHQKPEPKKTRYSIEPEPEKIISLSFKPNSSNSIYSGTTIADSPSKPEKKVNYSPFEEESSKEREQANVESNQQTQKNKKSGKAKRFVPFVMGEETIAAPAQQQKPAKKSEFDLLLEEEAKAHQKPEPKKTRYDIDPEPENNISLSFKPASSNTVYSGTSIKDSPSKPDEQKTTFNQAKPEKKKKKFTAFIAPEIESQQKVAKKTTTGPSFNDLFAAEEKSAPQEQLQQTKKGKNTTSVNRIEEYSFNPTPKFGAKKQEIKQTKGFNFNELLDAEIKAQPESKQTVVYSTQLNGRSFNDLLQHETERESAFDASVLEVIDVNTRPIFQEESKPKKKQTNKKQKFDEELFWDAGSIEVEEMKESDFPSLASTAPGQKKANSQIRATNDRIARIKRSPADFLAKQLLDAGLDKDESNETAQAVVNMEKQQMIESIKSLISNPKKAVSIVSSFFNNFPH